MSESVLITGSSGYIGSHFAKYFVKCGWRVLGLDRVLPPARVTKYLSANLHADISEEERVREFCTKENVTSVVHCAARALVGESMTDPEGYHDNNVVRGKKLADALQKCGVKAFLFSSTAAVYGEPIHTPIREDHPKKPINPYGASKFEFENDLLQRKGLAVGIFRYFNAAGADPENELGEVHDPETHLIPNAIRAGLGLIPAFELFGTDYKTRDGTCERDFIHVWDLAVAHELLLRTLLSTGGARIFNLGTSHGFTVKEVLDEVDAQLGHPVERRLLPRREGDPMVLIADPRKAMEELPWKPQHSDLRNIIRTAIDWHKQCTRS
ncbi:MAG: UDP-glucose 4-epimerase GalE [Pseudomonadota bacterium]